MADTSKIGHVPYGADGQYCLGCTEHYEAGIRWPCVHADTEPHQRGRNGVCIQCAKWWPCADAGEATDDAR